MSSGVIELELKNYQHLLTPRARDSHKGLFGHVLIIGGNKGLSGAVLLAGEAALRTGAGIVTIATHPDHARVLNVTRPELMVHAIENVQELLVLTKKATIIIIGPGLGLCDWGLSLLKEVVRLKTIPILFDADALRLLSQTAYESQPHHLYTPHPGEAAHLLSTNAEIIQQDRLSALTQLTKKFQGIVVLKGRQTLISQSNKPTYQCHQGNPGMSSPGMGDVLSGMIGALIAQHLPLLDAANLGVLLHALSADIAAKKGERGLLASDLFEVFRPLINPHE